MMGGKYDRSIALHCSTCAGTGFEHDEENDGLLICTNCDRSFTREELIRENGALIEAEVDDVKSEVAADIQRELRDTFSKAFRGSKHITFK